MPSLLLNADYSPIKVVSARHAVLLVVIETAESVVDSDDAYHSAGGLVVPVPSVLRLLEFKKVPVRVRLPVTRRNVLARDRGVCAYCPAKATTVDHVRPRSRGGRNVWENVVAACAPCNARKGDRLLAEIGWALRVKPFRPEGQLWVHWDAFRADPAWRPYVPALAS
jgi:5-methylcytosine-specific restriction endonuclease McrA